jgi:putative MFS transporter
MNRSFMKSIAIRDEEGVDRAINLGTPTSRMKWVWILGFGGIFFEAYSSAALASGLGPLIHQLKLSPVHVSVLTSTYLALAMVLCPIAGAVADRVGRVKMILIAKAIAALAMAIGLSSVNFEMLFVSRLIAGVAWAMDFGVVLVYISEWLADKQRGKLNRWQGMWYVATTTNLLVAVVIYQFDVGENIWRWLLGSAGLIALVLLVAQWFLLPESPRWLASRGRNVEAVSCVKICYDVEAHVAEAESTDRAATPKARFGDLFRGDLRRKTTLSFVAFTAQAWQYYAFAWYLPIITGTLFSAGFVGASLGSAAFNFFGIVGGFSSAYFFTKFRIRAVTQVGYLGVMILLIIFGAFVSVLPYSLAIVLPAAYILVHSALAAPSGAAFATVAFPTHLRALGLGFVTTGANAGSAIGLFLFPVMQAAWSTEWAILATAIVPFVGFLTATVIRWDPEIDANGNRIAVAATSVPVH